MVEKVVRLRRKIELGFEGLSRCNVHYKWVILFATLFMAALHISQLPNLLVDSPNESFFHQDDPISLKYDEYLQQFDRGELVVHTSKTDDHLFAAFLNKLEQLHLDIPSILVGSIAIGLSVDNTIYCIHHFCRFFLQTNNVEEAVDKIFQTSSKSRLFTSSLLPFATMTGAAILSALTADSTLAPALMVYTPEMRSSVTS